MVLHSNQLSYSTNIFLRFVITIEVNFNVLYRLPKGRSRLKKIRANSPYQKKTVPLRKKIR